MQPVSRYPTTCHHRVGNFLSMWMVSTSSISERSTPPREGGWVKIPVNARGPRVPEKCSLTEGEREGERVCACVCPVAAAAMQRRRVSAAGDRDQGTGSHGRPMPETSSGIVVHRLPVDRR